MMDDPAYIRSLLDPDSNYSCYFQIGDPNRGEVERIGVVPPMLMAHSLVLRRALDVQKAEVKEKFDIPVSDITPKAFKNVLRYAYGYNNIKNHSLPHSVELLALADRWVMRPMTQELASHIAAIITPVNVCLAMRDPVCLRVKKVEEEIACLVKKNAKRVLNSPYLHLVCPAGMRYIVMLKSLRASDVDVWRAVMRWAYAKVQKATTMLSPQVDTYLHPRLVVPCRKYVKMCSLNVIDLVEEVLADHPDKQKKIDGFIKYHFVPDTPSASMYMCIESKHAHHLKHEEFQVKIVNTSDAWMKPIYLTSTSLTVCNNTDKPVELYSIVCPSKQKLSQGLVSGPDILDPANYRIQVYTDFDYDISCFVKVFLISGRKETMTSLIKQVHFQTEVVFGNDFQILLGSDSAGLHIQPKTSYRIETKFSKPHPLWFAGQQDSELTPGQSSELEIGCGLVKKNSSLFGSHIKFLLYRESPRE